MPSMSEHKIRLQLQCALDDPMWPQHAEVSKDLLRGLAGLLHQLQAQALAQEFHSCKSCRGTGLVDSGKPYPIGGKPEMVFCHCRAQPSAASGWELQLSEREAILLGAISTASFGYWKEGDPIKPEYDTVALRDVAKLYAKYAALTGAAPADANVGGQQETFLLRAIPGLLPVDPAELAQFRQAMQETVIPQIVETMQKRDRAAIEIQDIPLTATPTAPEPSAPADKDAERYRWLISGHTLSELEDAARAGQQPRMTPQMEIIAHLATWYNCQEDKREIDTMIDAHMRPESGKGRKL